MNGAATPDALPRISVVVLTCGRPALLLRCLQALLTQTLPRPAYEIVVVDDGHDALTRRAVRRLAARLPPRCLRYAEPGTEPRAGPAVARNCGWRMARAELVAFTDDDTVPEPDWLAQGLATMACGRWVALAGRVVVPRPPGGAAAPRGRAPMTRGQEQAAFLTANAFVRTRALRRIGGFDERFRRAGREDSDLLFRLQQVGAVGRCEAALVLHPVQPERWGVALRQQECVFYDALLYRKHPHRYRAELRPVPPWDDYATVAFAIAAVVLLVCGHVAASACMALPALLAIAALTRRRLRATSRSPAQVLEMALTSALIPFLSVYWRLRGAWHFRVWFV